MIADIVFILDDSTSIVYASGSYDNWNVHILGFVRRICDSLIISPSYTQVGVVKFSEQADVEFYLNTYKDASSLNAAINALAIEGGETNIAAALRLTRQTFTLKNYCISCTFFAHLERITNLQKYFKVNIFYTTLYLIRFTRHTLSTIIYGGV